VAATKKSKNAALVAGTKKLEQSRFSLDIYEWHAHFCPACLPTK